MAPPRPARKKKRGSRREERSSFKYCKFCDTTQEPRGYANHLDWCTKEWELEQERKKREAQRHVRAARHAGEWPIPPNCEGPGPSSFDMDIDTLSPTHLNSLSSARQHSPNVSREDDRDSAHIAIVPHPKDLDAPTQIISLSNGAVSYTGGIPPTNDEASPASAEHRTRQLVDAARPFVPWQTLADFEYTETAVHSRMPAKYIEAQLRGFAGSWAGTAPKITLKTYPQYKKVLELSQQLGVKFKPAFVEGELWGDAKRYPFVFRDPWEWLYDIVTDPALARVITWKSRQCFYNEDGCRERFVDEPVTGDTWLNVDSQLPKPNPYPHCWLPLHIWLDKGLVTRHVTMFPIVLRLLSLPAEIRNASGNGGGVIIGFMVMVTPPGSSDKWTDRQRYEFAQFKREMYQKVLVIIFKSLFRRSWIGETVRCGDDDPRVLYPGFLINSLDFEEAWNFTCCRANRAKHPCPRCLISQDLIGCLNKLAAQRTTAAMRGVVERARKAPNPTQKEKILQDSGLHDITHFMWNFRFSDPYQAVTYDLLHFAELGKWGHHLWPLTMQLINEHGIDEQVTDIMDKFPRWRGLKHVNDPLTRDFSDGQTHFDIFKCMVFVLAELLPRNSPLIPCLRALLQIRMLAGLRVMTESRMQLLGELMKRYEKCCKKVTETYGKSFAWPKQHFLVHMLQDILAKGVLRNATTRVGEGIHQEVAQHFMKTNFRNVDEQIAHRDEEHEAIARTRLNVDDFFKHLRNESTDGDEDDDLCKEASQFRDGSTRKIPRSKLPPANTSDNWVLGSPFHSGDMRSYEDLHAAGDPAFRNFDPHLRIYLREAFPDEHLRYEDYIQIETYRCLYITYQSKDDWREGEDILRCNSNWYKRGPRYDCLMFNSADESLACARLRSLIRCKLPSGRIVDVAMVRDMETSRWRPKNDWDGRLVFDETKEFSFLLVDHVIRGALLAPVCPRPSGHPNLHYLVDVVDGDMFLRCLNSREHVCN